MTKKLDHGVASAEMKAAGLTPLDEYPGNKQKWRCRCDTCGQVVWPSLASVRNNGGGCRPCGLARSAKTRMLDEPTARKIMLDAGVEPLIPYPGSNEKWLSICRKCGKEVTPRYSNVKQGHAACVFCSEKSIDPEVAREVMLTKGFNPLVPFPGSNEPWKAICLKCANEVAPRFTQVKKGSSCRICTYKESGRKQRLNENHCVELFTSKNLKPLVPYPGSGRPWLSKCLKCGFNVSPTYNSIRNGSGCAVCGKRQVVPEIAFAQMAKANLLPLTPFPGSSAHWQCRCQFCGKDVFPKYSDVVSGSSGCKYCGGRFVDPEAAAHLMRLKGLVPQEPYVSSGAKWHCICGKCGRNVYPTYNSVQQGASGCGFCARRKVDPREAFEVMVNAGVTPVEEYPGARKSWHCVCNKCGLEVFPNYSSIANQGYSACVYCAGKKVDSDRAFSLMVLANLTPIENYKRADAPWKCTCNKCGRLVTPTYTSIRVGQGGCKYCAEKGLDFTAPAFLYLMENSAFRALKIGIGNLKTKSNRINEHEKNGWVLLQRIDFSSGETAYEVEQSVLFWMRNELGLKPFLTSKEMPQNGWTETFGCEDIAPESIWAKISDVISNL